MNMPLSHHTQDIRLSVGRPKDASKRDGIIRAATNLFMSKGYELTSMEAVAAKAGVSKITIYNNFVDKDELFKQVIQSRCNALAVIGAFADMAERKPQDALIEIGKNFAALMYNADSIRLHRIMLSEATRRTKTVQLFYEAGPHRVKKLFSDLLQQWVNKGVLKIIDIPKASEHYFSLLKGEMHVKVCLGIAATPTSEELAPHIAAAVRVFMSAYQPRV
jgi:TetR/AcrR family transcriptional repressor of mexJK operon